MLKTAVKNRPEQRIWWSNAILFIGIHIAAFSGIHFHPLRSTPRSTLTLAFVLWQIACFRYVQYCLEGLRLIYTSLV